MKYTHNRYLYPTAAVILLLLVWELSCRLGLVPAYLLPAPSQVLSSLVADAALIASHSTTTLIEALSGLAIGTILGFLLAVLMDRFERIALALTPLITLSQTVPTIAIAPLLVLWFGYGLLPKIVLVVLTTFFPVALSLYEGFQSLDLDYIDLMRSMHASELQIFFHVKLPQAMPGLMSGLRISAAYAIVGAVIAEWLGGLSGLGVYMTRVRKSFSYDRMFASIFVISALSLALMWVVDLAEKLLLPWKKTKGNN